MRVAYYYNVGYRPPRDDPGHNPYGSLLCEMLERHGIAVEFTITFNENYLRENQGRIDVLHWNWPHYAYYHDDAAIMARQKREFVRRLELARALGYKIVWTAHNLYPHNRRHHAIDRACHLEICRLATAIIAPCAASARELQESVGRAQNLVVIPHGNYIGVYSNHVTREQARAQICVPMDAFVYGLFGNIRPYKGIENLMDAFRQLPGSDAWLIIVGATKDRDYLEQVRLYPDLAPNDDLMLVLQAADVITLPFKSATTSGTLMLAFSSAKPAIAPAIGCLPAMMPPGAGILYDPSAKDALYQAMMAMRGWDLDAAGRLALAKAKKLDWDEIAALTMMAYQA